MEAYLSDVCTFIKTINSTVIALALFKKYSSQFPKGSPVEVPNSRSSEEHKEVWNKLLSLWFAALEVLEVKSKEKSKIIELLEDFQKEEREAA